MSSFLARSIADSESNSARGYEPFSLEPFCFDGDRQLKERCETQCQLELQSCIDGGCESKESCYKTNVDCVDCELFKFGNVPIFQLAHVIFVAQMAVSIVSILCAHVGVT